MSARKCCTIVLCVAVAAFVAVTVASAQVVHDDFVGDINTLDNSVVGGGTGFSNGQWYEYPQTTGPAWWNQWFFNSEEIKGWKWIEYDIQLTQLEPFPLDPTVEIAINWSGPDWTDPGVPPIPDAAANPNEFIVRESIFTGVVGDQPVDLTNRGDPIVIPDFNPIWVSIDVRTIDPGDPGTSPVVQLTGQLWHEHVPEPSTAVIGMLCICTAAAFRRGLYGRNPLV